MASPTNQSQYPDTSKIVEAVQQLTKTIQEQVNATKQLSEENRKALDELGEKLASPVVSPVTAEVTRAIEEYKQIVEELRVGQAAGKYPGLQQRTINAWTVPQPQDPNEPPKAKP